MKYISREIILKSTPTKYIIYAEKRNGMKNNLFMSDFAKTYSINYTFNSWTYTIIRILYGRLALSAVNYKNCPCEPTNTRIE